MKKLAALLALLPMLAFAHDKPKPKPEEPTVVHQRESGSKHFWRGVLVAGAIGGLVWVLTDRDACDEKAERAPLPPAKPKPVKPKKPRQCEIPAPAKPVTSLELRPTSGGMSAFIEHRF